MATRALYFPVSILVWKDIEKVAGRGLGYFFFDRLNSLLLLPVHWAGAREDDLV